jgi:hypothetical protein
MIGDMAVVTATGGVGSEVVMTWIDTGRFLSTELLLLVRTRGICRKEALGGGLLPEGEPTVRNELDAVVFLLEDEKNDDEDVEDRDENDSRFDQLPVDKGRRR